MRVLASITALSLSLLATPAIAQQDMSEVEIRAVEIRPGVAVLFGNGGNIGVSYGEDGTLLIDDQFAELTAKIQQAVADLGADPVRFLVNTHWHYDHAGGNVNLGTAGALIMAHDNIRKRLVEGGVVLGNEIPATQPEGLPVVTFDQGLTLHVNGDTIDLLFLGGGHTDGDTLVRFRKANVVHTGDMYLSFGSYPFIDLNSGGNVEHLLSSLAQVISLIDDETVVIPGHGDLSNKSELIAFRTMVATAVERVQALKDGGSTLDEAVAAAPLAGLGGGIAFVSDDDFVKAIWGSLEAHGH